MFEILLHVLAAYLAASRVWFSEHAHVQKCVSLATKDANATILQEREELRDVIIATQESAVVQLLLEFCIPTEEDQVKEILLCIHCRIFSYKFSYIESLIMV